MKQTKKRTISLLRKQIMLFLSVVLLTLSSQNVINHAATEYPIKVVTSDYTFKIIESNGVCTAVITPSSSVNIEWIILYYLIYENEEAYIDNQTPKIPQQQVTMEKNGDAFYATIDTVEKGNCILMFTQYKQASRTQPDFDFNTVTHIVEFKPGDDVPEEGDEQGGNEGDPNQNDDDNKQEDNKDNQDDQDGDLNQNDDDNEQEDNKDNQDDQDGDLNQNDDDNEQEDNKDDRDGDLNQDDDDNEQEDNKDNQDDQDGDLNQDDDDNKQGGSNNNQDDNDGNQNQDQEQNDTIHIEAGHYDKMSGIIEAASQISDLSTNNWIRYLIDIPIQGRYRIVVHGRSSGNQDGILVFRDAEQRLGTVTLPNNSENGDYRSDVIELKASSLSLTVVAVSGEMTVDWFELEPVID